MSQLIEFLMTLVGNKRFVDLIQQAVPRLIYITLGASARHAPDAKHFLSDCKTWSGARLNCWVAVLRTRGLLTGIVLTEAVSASCWKATACSFGANSYARQSGL